MRLFCRTLLTFFAIVNQHIKKLQWDATVWTIVSLESIGAELDTILPGSWFTKKWNESDAQINEHLNKQLAELKKETAELKKETAELKKETAESKKRTEELQKQNEILSMLIKRLEQL
jgi:Skp family chaperone for outer membrane proteins